jgi:hypothetical protein
MGAERDGGATDDLGQAATVHRAAGHRQVGRCVLPTGATDLKPARRGNGAQHAVAVGVLAGAHEAEITDVAGAGGGGRNVAHRIDALRNELDDRDAGGAEDLHMAGARDRHPVRHARQREDRRFRLQIEVPEHPLASAQHRAQSGLTGEDGMTGEHDEIRRERVGEIADRAAGQRAEAARPADHVHQPALVPQRARRAHDRRLRPVGPTRSEHGHSHAPSITDPCASPC